MKYLAVKLEGDGYRASLEETETPRPCKDEALIRVTGSGLNRADLSQIAGRYPPPPGESPILGLEVSGTLLETGEPVCALLAGGGHAEHVAAPKGQIFPVPDSMDLLTAAGIPEAFLTAFLNLGNLHKGDRALIHAGASGVGLAAIQTAKFLGSSVAATTRTASKIAAIKKAGADLAIDTSSSDFAEAIEDVWGRDSVNLILDPVGAATFAADLRVLATGGRVIFLATMSGADTDFDISLLMKKRARIIGSTLRSRPRPEKADLVARFRKEILPGFGTGDLSVHVDTVLPPARAGEAFERMKESQNVGKILIDWRPGNPG